MKLLAELRLEDKHNYNILLRMTSENFEKIFQLIKDDITIENITMGELIPLQLQPQLAFYQKGNCTRVMFISIILPTQPITVQHLLLFAFSSSPFFLF